MADNNQNQKSFRRNQNAEKLIESQKADRDALKASQNQTEAIKNLSTQSQGQSQPQAVQEKDYSPELQEINTAVQTSAAAAELELDISQELLELQRTTSEQQLQDNQSLLEKVDEASLEIQEWLNEILDKESKPVPMPEPVPPETVKAQEPDLKETIPRNEEKKERKENNSAVLAQLASMNKNIQGMAGNLTQMLLQTSLQAIKMTALAVAGILALDIVIGIAKTLYEKYSAEIQEFWKDTKAFFEKSWNVLKDLGITIGKLVVDYFKQFKLMEGFKAIAELLEDFSGGDFLGGLKNFMFKALDLFADNLSNIVESIVRFIPGMDGTADNIAANRAQRQLDRGVMPTGEDLKIYKKVNTESDDDRKDRQKDRHKEIEKLAKKKGIKLSDSDKNLVYSDSNEGKSKEYIALREEVEKDDKDLAAKPSTNDADIKRAQLVNAAEYAVLELNETPTKSEISKLERTITDLKTHGFEVQKYEQILAEAKAKRAAVKQAEEEKRAENDTTLKNVETSLDAPAPAPPPAPAPVPVQAPMKPVQTVNNNTIVQQSTTNNSSFIAPGQQSLQSFVSY